LAEQLILIVDDDESNRAVLAEILADDGYRVEAVSTAAEAQRIVDRERPSLLILDGPLASEKPQTTTLAARVPAVMVSAGSHIEREAAAIGVREWLRKPFDIDALLDLVRRQAAPQDHAA